MLSSRECRIRPISRDINQSTSNLVTAADNGDPHHECRGFGTLTIECDAIENLQSNYNCSQYR